MHNLNLKLFLSLFLIGNAICYSAAAQSSPSHSNSDWNNLKKNLKGEQLEYFTFLEETLSLPDKTDYSPQFYLDNLNIALKAKEEMPWGKDLPEKEFRHFVVPLRVNNEDLDSFRTVYYDELKERVKGLSIEDAILEINHWCHEKVTYQPSDSRTSSPMSAISQAIGRCGEESTFTVAALRTVGIPARQVYTPRWAHTDDNHAWVEAWADGKWHFIGACEPAPILDLAWFNQPASRGMLMNTQVQGTYPGPEEILEQSPITTTINVTSNYAPTQICKVQIVDTEGNPVSNAKVAFSIYNYADLYPVVTRISDDGGFASVNSGLGDFIVWASDGEKYGFAKASPKDIETTSVVLDKNFDYSGDFEFLIVPPVQSSVIPKPSKEQDDKNNIRLSMEDSIRKAYTSTFFVKGKDAIPAQLNGLNADKLTKILSESRGNHKNITDYLISLEPDKRETATDLLLAVTEKDRRDIPVEVIDDNIGYTLPNGNVDYETWVKFILNPRVDRERLTPYKSFFTKEVNPVLANKIKTNPSYLVEWVKDSIEIENLYNPKKVRMSPVGTWTMRKADPISRDIFFVALARSLGIPAEKDPVTGSVKYLDNNVWKTAEFDAPQDKEFKTGNLNLDYVPVGRVADPIYYTHFALSKLENGMPSLLEFDDGMTLSQINQSAKPLEEGEYLLLSGQRMADGSVMAKGKIFHLYPDSINNIEVIIPQDNSKVQVIGSLNAENPYFDINEQTSKSILSTTGRGYYILGIIRSNHEPSSHALNDISALKDEFENWGGKIMVLFENEDAAQRFDAGAFRNLPSNLVFGIDNSGINQSELIESLNLDGTQMPLFVIADTFNRVVFLNEGYTIGLGNQILDTLSRIK